MEYTVDYFIKKFEAIPEYLWLSNGAIHDSNGRSCAYGHCDQRGANSLIGKSMTMIFMPLWTNEDGMGCISEINDGNDIRYQQPTPKQRILAALYDIKKLQQSAPEVKVIHHYVSVPESINEQTKELILS